MSKRFELMPSLYGALGSVSMSCDKPLSEKPIKPPFPNRSFAICITGPPGSGKTSFALSLLKKARRKTDNVYYRVFRDILWVCPSSSRGSIQGSPLEDLTPDSVFDELSFSVQDKIDENKREYEKKGKPFAQLLLIDDCGGTLKNHLEMLNGLFMNRRHLSLSIIILTQYTVSLPKSVRAQISMPIMFKPSPQDFETIRKEYTNLSKADFKHLSDFVWKGKHDFLIIDRDTDTYYKNLQKIEIH